MSVTTDRQRFAWVTLEAQEIIELKQAIMDRDSHDVVDFFFRVVVPRAKESAQKRGISLQEDEESNGRISG
jgi:predicted glycoside hydrolase/deacetylase ChbG (UPF0249 family)